MRLRPSAGHAVRAQAAASPALAVRLSAGHAVQIVPAARRPLALRCGVVPAQPDGPAPNLLANGGFEHWPVSPGLPPAWTANGGLSTRGETTRDTASPLEGLNAARIERTQADATVQLEIIQTLVGGGNLVAGQAYRVRISGKAADITTGNTNQGNGASVRLRNTTDSVNVFAQIGGVPAAWTPYAFTFQAVAAKSYALSAILGSGTNVGAKAFLDAGSVSPIEARNSAGSYQGALRGGTNTTGPTPTGDGYDFDGVDDYVEFYAPALGTAFAIEATLRCDTVTAARVFLHGPSSGRPSMEVSTGRNLTGAWRSPAGVADFTGTANGLVTLGQTHHALYQYTGAGAEVWLDAVLRATETLAGLAGGVPAGKWRIGSYNGPSLFFDGLLRDVRLWSGTLTPADVAYLKTEALAGRRPDPLLVSAQLVAEFALDE